MSRNSTILLVVGVCIAIFIGILVISKLNNAEQKYFRWVETYEKDDQEPYGGYVIFNMLDSYFPEQEASVINEFLDSGLPNDPEDSASYNYVYLGDGYPVETEDIDALIQFVEKGNTAFIGSSDFSDELLVELWGDSCEYWGGVEYFTDSSAILNLTHTNLEYTENPPRYHYQYKRSTWLTRWHYFTEDYWCENGLFYYNLGTIGSFGNINFISIPRGEGQILIHTTPIAFTNYYLIEDEGREYAERIFSHLPEGQILWDAHLVNNDPRNRAMFSESPLKYILSQPSLAWAWYLSLVLVLLYLLFGAKRRQRIIPILKPNVNTSLEFVRSMGQLYLLQKKPRKLALTQFKLFLAFVRDRYSIHTHVLDEQLVDAITKNSELPREKITKILNMYESINESPSITNNRMMEFHMAIENFYKNCK